MDDDENKRRHERIHFPYVLKFRSVQARADEMWDAVNPVNMSESGICFLTTNHFLPGTQMQLLVTNPATSQQRILECHVLRSTRSTTLYQTVVEIGDINEEDKEVYLKLLKEFKKKS